MRPFQYLSRSAVCHLHGTKTETLRVHNPGKYWVTALDRCGIATSDTIFVSQVDLSFSAGSDQTICLYDSVHLNASYGFKNYKWSANDMLVETNSNQITLFPEKNTKYVVSVEKFPGCVLEDSVSVLVKPCPQKIVFPNAFTPNADGLNDIFKPYVEGNISSYSLRIYNRYGQLIFHTFDTNRGWDGFFKNEAQPVGSYVFLCQYRFPGQPQRILRGSLQLVK